jgi:hypothetical protein
MVPSFTVFNEISLDSVAWAPAFKTKLFPANAVIVLVIIESSRSNVISPLESFNVILFPLIKSKSFDPIVVASTVTVLQVLVSTEEIVIVFASV